MTPTFAGAGAQAGAHLSDAGVDDGGQGHQGQVSRATTTTVTGACVKVTGEIHLRGEKHIGDTCIREHITKKYIQSLESTYQNKQAKQSQFTAVFNELL